MVGFVRFHNILKFINVKEGHTNNIVLAFVVTSVYEECLCDVTESLVYIRDDINHNVKVCNIKVAHTRSCRCSVNVEMKSDELVGKQLCRMEMKQMAEVMW